jgi:hypothetical protein
VLSGLTVAGGSAGTAGGDVYNRGTASLTGCTLTGDSPPDIGAFQTNGFTLKPVTGSTPQTAAIGSRFARPLAITVIPNYSLEPVVGGTVRFLAPQSGASANLSRSGAGTIGQNGQASVTATAVGRAGSSTVTAATAGAKLPALFKLTNKSKASLLIDRSPRIRFRSRAEGAVIDRIRIENSTRPPPISLPLAQTH